MNLTLLSSQRSGHINNILPLKKHLTIAERSSLAPLFALTLDVYSKNPDRTILFREHHQTIVPSYVQLSQNVPVNFLKNVPKSTFNFSTKFFHRIFLLDWARMNIPSDM